VAAIGGFVKRNWFLCGMVCVVAGAIAAPGLGSAINPRRALSTAAVVAIFVLSGLSLPSEEVRRGLRSVRVHLFVQGFVFVVIPAWFYVTGGLFADVMEGKLLIGFYALAVLPTTISSCIVFTQMARGNVAATIFNAVVANLLGVFISPLLLTLLLHRAGRTMPVDQMLGIFASLLWKVLAPFVAGQLLRLPLRDFAGRHKKRFTAAGSCLVLLIIYLAFSRAAGSDLLSRNAWRLAGPFAYLAASNVVLMGLAYGGARAIRLGPADVVTAVFTAPQKTLAMGIPLLTIYFASQPDVLAFAMLPVLFYHPWQLLTAGVARGLLAVPEAPD